MTESNVATDLDDETELVERLRAGEDSAFHELLTRYGARLLAVAQRLLANDADANDALQEAMLSAFTRLEAFRGGSRLYTWLHRIVVNAALMRMRARKRRPETSIEELLPRYQADGHPARHPEQWQEPPERALEREETRAFVRAAIQELPDTHRAAVVLADIEGFSMAEVSELLGVSVGAAKVRVHRGRMALRSLLDKHMRGTNA